MSSESGTVAIGEEEYQLQVRKHGSVKHVGLLAKQVARVILMMGLGPTDGILGEVLFLVMLLKICTSVHLSPMFRVYNLRVFHGASFSFAFA